MADDDATGTLDVTALSESIGSDLFPPAATPEPEGEIDVTHAPTAPVSESPVEPVISEPTVRSAPKSWPKEMHEHWGKTDPKVQDYWETREKQMLDGLEQYKNEASFAKAFKEALTPYQQTIRSLGMDEIKAAQSLFNADHQLRYSTPEQKLDHFKRLAQHYGVDVSAFAGQAGQPQTPVDPALKAIQDELQTVKQTLTARQQAEFQAAKTKVGQEVEAFASDTKAHPYFDEVASDMTPFLQAGLSLQDAYNKAVWANDVTRAKEQARLLQEHEAKLKENARLTALPKQRAASINVKSRETKRTPTEPLSTMEDTLRSTLSDIRSRA